MVSDIHFISGLPRSGSTLLCAILKQNPRFEASMTSPVVSLIGSIMPKMTGGSEFAVFFNDDRRRVILRSVVKAYYADVAAGKVVFDTNRTWTGRTALLHELYPKARIICCVREVGWIIDSMERMLRKNPLQLSRILNYQPGSSIYARTEMLMNSENGLIGLAWSCLREAWFSEHAKKLLIISYDKLVREPQATIERLYEELHEPFFKHEFDNVSYEEQDYDAAIGMPGLHKVRQKVEYRKQEPGIPPDIFAKYTDINFWMKPEMNRRGA